MEEQFVIKDLDEFVLATRKVVYNLFLTNNDMSNDIDIMFKEITQSDKDEFDTSLSQEEAKTIIKQFIIKQINKKTKKIRYLVNNDSYIKILENLNSRMVSNILNSLVNKGFLESAYDTESDDFVFWVKDEHKKAINKIIEKPETD